MFVLVFLPLLQELVVGVEYPPVEWKRASPSSWCCVEHQVGGVGRPPGRRWPVQSENIVFSTFRQKYWSHCYQNLHCPLHQYFLEMLFYKYFSISKKLTTTTTLTVLWSGLRCRQKAYQNLHKINSSNFTSAAPPLRRRSPSLRNPGPPGRSTRTSRRSRRPTKIPGPDLKKK